MPRPLVGCEARAMNGTKPNPSSVGLLAQLGLAGLGPLGVTVFAGLLFLIGAGQPGFDALLWIMWGLIFALIGVSWTILALIYALCALSGVRHERRLRLENDRDAAIAVAHVNGTVILIWILGALVIVAATH